MSSRPPSTSGSRAAERSISAIGDDTVDELAARLAPLALRPSPTAALRTMAAAVRSFAKDHPRSYELLFMNLPEASRPTAELNARASGPLLAAAERLVGAEDALEAARLLTAFTHGFISMELNGAFRLGGIRIARSATAWTFWWMRWRGGSGRSERPIPWGVAMGIREDGYREVLSSVLAIPAMLRVVDPLLEQTVRLLSLFGKPLEVNVATGTIKKIVADRGFGFIAAEDAKEYFFHRDALLTGSLDFDRLLGRGARDIRESNRVPRVLGPVRYAQPDRGHRTARSGRLS